MLYQCYYIGEDGKRCTNEQEECWCSKLHENLWKEDTYGIKTREDKKRLTIPEMQKRLKEMGKTVGY